MTKKLDIPLVPLAEFGHIWQDNTRTQVSSEQFGFERFFTVFGENKKGEPTEKVDALKLVSLFLDSLGKWRIDQGVPQSWSLKADKGKLSAETRKTMTQTVIDFRTWLRGKEFPIQVPNSLLPDKAAEDQSKTSRVVVTGEEVIISDQVMRGETPKDSQWKHRCHSTFRRTMFVVPIFNTLCEKIGRADLMITHIPVEHKVFISEEAAEEDRRKENNLKTAGFRRLNAVDDLYNGRRHMDKFGFLREAELKRKLGVNRGRIQKVYPTIILDRQHPELHLVDRIIRNEIPFTSVDKEVARKLVIPDDPRDPTWEVKDERPFPGALSPAQVMEKAGVTPTSTSGLSYKQKELTALLKARRDDVKEYYLNSCTVKRTKAPSLKATLKAVKDGSPVQLVKDVATAIASRDDEAMTAINSLSKSLNAAYVAAQEGDYMLLTPDGEGLAVPAKAVKAVLAAINKHAPKSGSKSAQAG